MRRGRQRVADLRPGEMVSHRLSKDDSKPSLRPKLWGCRLVALQFDEERTAEIQSFERPAVTLPTEDQCSLEVRSYSEETGEVAWTELMGFGHSVRTETALFRRITTQDGQVKNFGFCFGSSHGKVEGR